MQDCNVKDDFVERFFNTIDGKLPKSVQPANKGARLNIPRASIPVANLSPVDPKPAHGDTKFPNCADNP